MNIADEIHDHDHDNTFTAMPGPSPRPVFLKGMDAQRRLLVLKLHSSLNEDDFYILYERMMGVILQTKPNSYIRKWANQGFAMTFAMFSAHGLHRVQDIDMRDYSYANLDVLSSLSITPNETWHRVLRVWHYLFLGKLLNAVNECDRHFHIDMQKRLMAERVLLCGEIGEEDKFPLCDIVPNWELPGFNEEADAHDLQDFYDRATKYTCTNCEFEPDFQLKCRSGRVAHCIAYTAALHMQLSCIPSELRLCGDDRCKNTIGTYMARACNEQGQFMEVIMCSSHLNDNFEMRPTNIPIPQIDVLKKQYPSAFARYMVSTILNAPHMHRLLSLRSLARATFTMLKSLAFVVKNDMANFEGEQQSLPLREAIAAPAYEQQPVPDLMLRKRKHDDDDRGDDEVKEDEQQEDEDDRFLFNYSRGGEIAEEFQDAFEPDGFQAFLEAHAQDQQFASSLFDLLPTGQQAEV